MSHAYGSPNSGRPVDDPRNYRVRLSRFGSHAPGDFKPSPITVMISATSSMQARTNAQASHPGYDVTDVQEGVNLGGASGVMDAVIEPAVTDHPGGRAMRPAPDDAGDESPNPKPEDQAEPGRDAQVAAGDEAIHRAATTGSPRRPPAGSPGPW